MAIKNDFSALIEEELDSEDFYDIISETSCNDFGVLNDMTKTLSFNEEMDLLFPSGVSEENMSVLD